MNQLEQPPGKRVLSITSAVTFLGFLDTNLLVPVVALFAAELGASVGVIGIIVGLYSITNTPANMLFGRVIDRFGARLPLVAGLIGDALAMFLYSLCRLPFHLALVRAFHGLTGAAVGPATMSLIADYSAKREKGRAMGIYGMAMATASLVGFGLSGVIVSRLGYRALFLSGAALLTIGVVLSLLLPRRRGKDGKTAGSPSGEIFKQVKSLLARRGLSTAYGSIFAQYFTFGGVVTLLPIYLKALGMEAFHMGMLLAIFAVMFMITQFPAGNLSDRVGRLIPIISGLGLSIVSLVILPSLVTFPLLAAVMALYGVAYGILFPSISALVVDHTVPEERGMATGVFHALLTTGVAIGAPIMGWAAGVIGIGPGLALSAGIMVLALIMALTTFRRG